MVDVVTVDVVGARRSYSGCGRCGRGRRGRSSAELLGTWSTWSELGVARLAARLVRRDSLDGSAWLADGSLDDSTRGLLGRLCIVRCKTIVPLCQIWRRLAFAQRDRSTLPVLPPRKLQIIMKQMVEAYDTQ